MKPLRSFVIWVMFAAGAPAVLAQMQDVKAGLAKSIWTAETIRAVRAGGDYKALMGLVIAEAATKANVYPTADALKQAIVKAQQLAENVPTVSLDPDLNPATFREMLRRLQNSGVLPQDVLDGLVRELSRSSADITAEESIRKCCKAG